jgi:hypothetical protein
MAEGWRGGENESTFTFSQQVLALLCDILRKKNPNLNVTY